MNADGLSETQNRAKHVSDASCHKAKVALKTGFMIMTVGTQLQWPPY